MQMALPGQGAWLDGWRRWQHQSFAESRRCLASASSAKGTDTEAKSSEPKPTLQSLLQEADRAVSEGEVGSLASISAAAAAATTPDAPASTSATLERELELQLEGDRAASASSSSSSGTPLPDAGAQDPALRLLHKDYGYAALGGVLPDAGGQRGPYGRGGAPSLLGGLAAEHPRLHPSRRFLPGMSYEPQDLNPLAQRSRGEKARRGIEVASRPSVQEVLEHADYKNVAFLSRFLSPAGRLLPRRQTKLPLSVHRLVTRQVKLARHMGLMAGEARLDKLHLARVREEERQQLQHRHLQQQRAAAAAGGQGGQGARESELLDFGA